MALREVARRLQAKGKDSPANKLLAVAEALHEAETIHIADGAGTA